MYAEFIVRAEF